MKKLSANINKTILINGKDDAKEILGSNDKIELILKKKKKIKKK
jgi:hypothetical protein